MKRLPFAMIFTILIFLTAVGLPVLFAGLCNLFHVGVHGDFSPYQMELSFENAPEGTVYIDPLIKIESSDENYTNFTAAPIIVKYNNDHSRTYTSLNITVDSEIATFNKDGYISMSLHLKNCELKIYKANGSYHSACEFPHEGSLEIDEIADNYGKFKAAYIDENGKVLGVTKAARYTYNASEPYALDSDSGKLTYRIYAISPLQGTILVIVIIAEGAAIVALAVFVILALINKISGRSSERKMS